MVYPVVHIVRRERFRRNFSTALPNQFQKVTNCCSETIARSSVTAQETSNHFIMARDSNEYAPKNREWK
jgi:hypothetical protein